MTEFLSWVIIFQWEKKNARCKNRMQRAFDVFYCLLPYRYQPRLMRLNLRSLRRASACLRRFFTLGFS